MRMLFFELVDGAMTESLNVDEILAGRELVFEFVGDGQLEGLVACHVHELDGVADDIEYLRLVFLDDGDFDLVADRLHEIALLAVEDADGVKTRASTTVLAGLAVGHTHDLAGRLVDDDIASGFQVANFSDLSVHGIPPLKKMIHYAWVFKNMAWRGVY